MIKQLATRKNMIPETMLVSCSQFFPYAPGIGKKSPKGRYFFLPYMEHMGMFISMYSWWKNKGEAHSRWIMATSWRAPQVTYAIPQFTCKGVPNTIQQIALTQGLPCGLAKPVVTCGLHCIQEFFIMELYAAEGNMTCLVIRLESTEVFVIEPVR